MSRLCAKPTCSGTAIRWFDVDGAARQVIEQLGPTPTSIALCETHADRFSTPKGWSWVDREAPVDDPVEQLVPSAPTGEALIAQLSSEPPVTRRQHSRDVPWFLANSSRTSESPDLLPSTSSQDDVAESSLGEPSFGSLLHRAFHGPDRAVDTARARDAERNTGSKRAPQNDEVATVRDITSRRAARNTVASYDVELPFPPADSSPQVAVS